ncbi:MAG: F0F1 ATP synthase subunit B' [Alphaproteobacteria bacterium]|nr:F0F1 ATP synthase subunit B' [Alphaproteobacteria bacterium]
MPQLDPTWFLSQLVWLVIMFSLLYVLMSKVALPPITEVLEERQHRVEEDIKKAGELKSAAEAALRTYEEALAGANKEAKKIIAEAKDEMAELAASKDKELTAKLAQRVKEGENKVAKAKEEALKEVRTISEGVVSSMVEKLCGVKPSKEDIDKALDAALKEQA